MYLVCACMRACVCTRVHTHVWLHTRAHTCVVACAIMYIRGSEDKLWESVLSLHYANPRDWMQVIRLGSKLLPTEPALWLLLTNLEVRSLRQVSWKWNQGVNSPVISASGSRGGLTPVHFRLVEVTDVPGLLASALSSQPAVMHPSVPSPQSSALLTSLCLCSAFLRSLGLYWSCAYNSGPILRLADLHASFQLKL